MNFHQLEKTESTSQWKAVLYTFLIPLVLLGGLYYFNAEDPSAILPDFVLELLDSQLDQEVAIAKSEAP